MADMTPRERALQACWCNQELCVDRIEFAVAAAQREGTAAELESILRTMTGGTIEAIDGREWLTIRVRQLREGRS